MCQIIKNSFKSRKDFEKMFGGGQLFICSLRGGLNLSGLANPKISGHSPSSLLPWHQLTRCERFPIIIRYKHCLTEQMLRQFMHVVSYDERSKTKPNTLWSEVSLKNKLLIYVCFSLLLNGKHVALSAMHFFYFALIFFKEFSFNLYCTTMFLHEAL